MTEPPADLTVVEAIDQFRGLGYVADFSLRDGAIECGTCNHLHDVATIEIDELLRVEGASDPADEAIVVALRCRSCGCSGVLVAGYGPTADPAESDMVRVLLRSRQP